jgi:hypothetical protein
MPMACPWFSPLEYLSPGPGKSPAPLGDAWSGLCRAAPGTGWTPDAETLRRLCNFGYAREKCPRLPPDGPDAVRFSITQDRDGLIRIYWVVEKNHLPFAHGHLDYSRAEARFESPPPDARIAQQAQAYVCSYLRRREAVRP